MDDHAPPAETGADPELAGIANPTEAARGAVYGLLARLFEEPDAETYEKLAAGEVGRHLSDLVAQAGLERDLTVPSLRTEDDRELLGARFNDLFEVGYPEPPVPLYESAYHDEGRWEEINVDLARAYDYFGVSIDDSRREHHDHLVLELEFAGYLARLAAVEDREDVRAARRDFLDRHLVGFADDLASAIEDEVEAGIFDDQVAFLAAFASADLASLEATLETTQEVPQP